MFDDVSFATHKFSLSCGDSLLLYTDGVTEAVDHNGDEFGVDRLLQSVDGCTNELAALLQKCGQAVSSFRGSGDRTDDLTLMALRYSTATEHALAA